MGTGIEASVVVSANAVLRAEVPALIADMSRFGTAVRGDGHGEKGRRILAPLWISNQKTLGQSEKGDRRCGDEGAIQLTNQEMTVRKMSLQRRRLNGRTRCI